MSTLPKVARTGRQPALRIPHQISMMFDTPELRRLTLTQRAKVLAQLANLLMLAASGAAKENDDDER